jgi:hypothetical protein
MTQFSHVIHGFFFIPRPAFFLAKKLLIKSKKIKNTINNTHYICMGFENFRFGLIDKNVFENVAGFYQIYL